jgi:hypothetical protein
MAVLQDEMHCPKNSAAPATDCGGGSLYFQ